MLDIVIGHKNVLKVIRFGSKVYGTASEYSDNDYVVVLDGENVYEQVEYEGDDFHFISIDIWNTMCDMHDIRCIEAYFTDESHWLKGEKDTIDIDFDMIRSEFSQIASNSWVKCKKKLTVEKDYNPYIAKKSLFHSLRILEFGRQIMKFGFIYDFTRANIYFDEIMSYNDDWEQLKERFQPIYNDLKTQFKKAQRKRNDLTN